MLTPSMKTALLTVGSTQFAPFVTAALQEDTLEALAEQGYTRFIVQYGKQERSPQPPVRSIQVELHAFMADIEEKMQQVDLVLSHAGVCRLLESCIRRRQHVMHMFPAFANRRWIHPCCFERSSVEPIDSAKEAHHRAERYTHGCTPI